MNEKCFDAAMLLHAGSARTAAEQAQQRKELDLLWKLTEGQLWDIQTDSTAAYRKTVPAGAVAAEIGSVGGRTAVWNMQSKNDRPSGTNNGVTYTNDDGVWHISGSVDGASSFYILDSAGSRGTATAGHVYLVYNNSGVTSYLYLNASKSGMDATRLENGAVLYTVPAERDGQSVAVGFRLEEGESADNSGRAWFLDLTQMLGSDVPASVEDPRIPEIIAYANAHPGYDAGTPLHAAVTSVVSKHKEVVWNNQIGPTDWPNITANGVTYTKSPDGGVTLSGSAEGTSYSVSTRIPSVRNGDKILIFGINNGSSDSYFLRLLPNSGTGIIAYEPTIGTYEFNNINSFRIYVANGYTFSEPVTVYPHVVNLTQMFGADAPTETSDPRIAAILAYAEAHPEYNESQIIAQTTVGGQIVFTPDITVATLDIPAAVRALEGYGQSAFGGDGNTLDLADGTYTEIGHYVDGVWTLLDTPSVTDVSGLLPDNMLEAAAGGTLTFVSEAGLAVPNSVDYLIKLAEVTP